MVPAVSAAGDESLPPSLLPLSLPPPRAGEERPPTGGDELRAGPPSILRTVLRTMSDQLWGTCKEASRYM